MGGAGGGRCRVATRRARAALSRGCGVKRGVTVRSLLLALAIFAVLAALYVWPATRSAIRDIETLSTVWRFRVRGVEPIAKFVRDVGITEHTIQAFADAGVYYPLPREWHATALRRLADAGAQIVVVDILFSESGSWDESEDQALADAIRYCRAHGCQVVLAAGVEEARLGAGISSATLLRPAPLIMEAQPVLGLGNTLPKLSFKLTEFAEYPLQLQDVERGGNLHSQAVAAFRLYCEGTGRDFNAELRRATPSGARAFPIHYCGPPEQLPGLLYSFERLFPGLFEGSPGRELTATEQAELRRLFQGTVVFIGSRAKPDNDYFNTPFGLMFGVDTNAQAFDTLARRRLIYTVPPAAVLLLAALLSLIAWGVSLLRPLARSVGLGAVVLGGLVAGDFALFAWARVELSLAATTAAFALPYVGCALYSGLREEAAKRWIRATFARYVAPEVVSQIVANPQLADLGGVERTVAVLFNDIRSYSTLTENLTPHEVVRFLNCYFSEAAAVIRRHRGFVDKYLGDGLMACFGGPVPTADPAGDALRAALEMVRVLHEQVLPRLDSAGLPQFRMGIGLHYGNVVMGNIGGLHHVNYTVIGDAVTVASRVENLTKDCGWAVLATKEVLEHAQGDFDAEFIGEQKVKGRDRPVAVYRVVDTANVERFRL